MPRGFHRHSLIAVKNASARVVPARIGVAYEENVHDILTNHLGKTLNLRQILIDFFTSV